MQKLHVQKHRKQKLLQTFRVCSFHEAGKQCEYLLTGRFWESLLGLDHNTSQSEFFHCRQAKRNAHSLHNKCKQLTEAQTESFTRCVLWGRVFSKMCISFHISMHHVNLYFWFKKTPSLVTDSEFPE